MIAVNLQRFSVKACGRLAFTINPQQCGRLMFDGRGACIEIPEPVFGFISPTAERTALREALMELCRLDANPDRYRDGRDRRHRDV